MAEVSISKAEFDDLATKLDSLSPQLSDPEQALLLAVFRLAGEAAARETDGGSATFAQGNSGVIQLDGSAENVPDLSAGFLEAFMGGRPGGFGQDLASSEVTFGIKIRF